MGSVVDAAHILHQDIQLGGAARNIQNHGFLFIPLQDSHAFPVQENEGAVMKILDMQPVFLSGAGNLIAVQDKPIILPQFFHGFRTDALHRMGKLIQGVP